MKESRKEHIISFINKIIAKGSLEKAEETRKLITDFREFLTLSKSITEEYELLFDSVLEYLDELLTLKENNVSVVSVTDYIGKKDELLEKPKMKKRKREYINPHYLRYIDYGSIACGGGGGWPGSYC